MSELETRHCAAGDLTMCKEGWAFCDAQDEKRSGTQPDHRCLNCKHVGEAFEIDLPGDPHAHCGHPDWKIASWPEGWAKSEADIGGWDTLRDAWDTCKYWEEN